MAVMVAVSLMVLIGFVGAGVDLASIYAKSQEVQNGADAAALAVAQQCAGSEGCPDDDDLASTFVAANVRSQKESVAVDVTYPDANRVSVRAQGQHDNYFLAILNIDSTQIGESASAVWGVPTKGVTTMPLTFSRCSFEKQGGATGKDVVLYLPKHLDGSESCITSTSGVAMPAGFAYIDDQGATSGCGRLVEAGGWIASQTGNTPKGCKAEDIEVGTTVLVPIYDYCWTDKHNVKDCTQGAPEPPGYTKSWDRWYHIESFAAIKISGYYLGSIEAGSPVPCKGEDRCIRGAFVEYVSLDDAWEYGDGPDRGAAVVALVD
ncbi:pilus assembly protein TadG-related protein [Ornithinimicrobium pekingense]|uniref:pilus assembly protein TadG-related protein n=1 Tax=Ornithinimicrobium pekingense TaxID=384677 RepID=UPI00146A72B8|nr:pilus assembly protein TadG-related protein [Ornithinimicrobium pekingense]